MGFLNTGCDLLDVDEAYYMLFEKDDGVDRFLKRITREFDWFQITDTIRIPEDYNA